MAKTKPGWDGYSLKRRREVPEGLWMACPSCQNMLYRKTVEENLHVCPECDHHFRIDGKERLRQLVDEGSFEEQVAEMTSTDPLAFAAGDTRYADRIQAYKNKG
ncbi:MAG TPA: acetyl-CoA carboxylase carboxyl transferase subunit beta, partial [Halothiobacillaceae bacterium]|nr:acetyl-CoA carboxylase carboxyl transferase subunit beta [Halothiobacillaceae bacterium]